MYSIKIRIIYAWSNIRGKSKGVWRVYDRCLFYIQSQNSSGEVQKNQRNFVSILGMVYCLRISRFTSDLTRPVFIMLTLRLPLRCHRVT
jgi:hypothetical protein